MYNIIYTFIFLFGLIIGSFLNCLVWRVYKEESLLGRSYCPNCKHKIRWYDNIPVLSFLFLGGKCRDCKSDISWQYPLVELITGILFVFIFYFNLSNYQLPITNFVNLSTFYFLLSTSLNFFFVSVMIAIFIFDARWYIIPDVISLPAIIIVFILNILIGANWLNLLLSGIIGGGFFLAQYLISHGKWIGGGDIRLGLLMGVFLGFPKILLALFLAYIIGAIISVFLLIFKKKSWSSEIPFGIFLTTATIITMFFGTDLINWYLLRINLI